MNQVPWLRKGVGKNPQDGGCIMQVIDWISSRGWTDNPKCVHPVIRHLAIYVNDHCTDEERQRLLDLSPRLMGTNTGDERLSRQLLGYLARQVYPIWEQWQAKSGYDDGGAVLDCIEAAEQGEAAWAAEAAEAARAAGAAEAAWAARAAEAAEAAWAARAAEAAEAAWVARAAEAAEAAWAAEAAGAAGAAEPMSLLVGLLDRYDELTGRGQSEPISEEQWLQVCEVMRA